MFRRAWSRESPHILQSMGIGPFSGRAAATLGFGGHALSSRYDLDEDGSGVAHGFTRTGIVGDSYDDRGGHDLSGRPEDRVRGRFGFVDEFHAVRAADDFDLGEVPVGVIPSPCMDELLAQFDPYPAQESAFDEIRIHREGAILDPRMVPLRRQVVAAHQQRQQDRHGQEPFHVRKGTVILGFCKERPRIPIWSGMKNR